MNTIMQSVRRSAIVTLILTNSILGTSVSAAAAPVEHSQLFKPWINGVSAREPQMQVQRYDNDTYVIRQSIRTNFEGPFLYVLFGSDRALLIDTGAGGLNVRPTIDRVIDEWAARHHRMSIPLVVAHSHSHGDHHQGDAEFQDRPHTIVVGLYPKDVADFFKITDWPNQIVSYDLGGRVLDIIPTPGHQSAHIMVFDRKTRLMFSGDSLGPYRLYVSDERGEDLSRQHRPCRGLYQGQTGLLDLRCTYRDDHKARRANPRRGAQPPR
jgi:glyoxylase-like metal-dependent hydrolase (beta-lactamase superfamily II)